MFRIKTHVLNKIGCLLVFVLCLFSCKKDKGFLAEMKQGKYEVINFRTLSNGQKDTIRCMAYGPKIFEGRYQFTTSIKDKLLDKIDLAGRKRKQFTRVRYYSESFSLPGYFDGEVQDYDLTEDNLTVTYKSQFYGNVYSQDTIISGLIKFTWVGL